MTVAVGDRVICRRNDRFADVDNGTRGTVIETRESGLLIRTDAGPERELPAGYVAEHVEHAYCLTGRGMQGATVEHATVVAAPRALTRGWSYTALSRGRRARPACRTADEGPRRRGPRDPPAPRPPGTGARR